MVADRAFLNGNISVAQDLYFDVLTFLDCCNDRYPHLRGLSEQNYLNSWKRLKDVCLYNDHHMLVRLGVQTGNNECFQVALIEDFIDATKEPHMTPEISLLAQWTRALAYFALRKHAESVQMIHKAVAIAPNNESVQRTSDSLTEWSAMSAGSMKPAAKKHKAVLTRLAKLLTSQPLQAERWKDISEEADVDWERYMLRELGYNGVLLEDRVKQKIGFCVVNHKVVPGTLNKEIADKEVARGLKRLDDEKKRTGRAAYILLALVMIPENVDGLDHADKQPETFRALCQG